MTQTVASTEESRPYRAATTHPIQELLDAEGRYSVLHKDLNPARLTAAARLARPTWINDPMREILVYQRLLIDAPAGPPRLIAAGTGGDTDTGRHGRSDSWWIRLEHVEGAPLTEVGDLERWLDAARWVGHFHAWVDTFDHLPDVHPVRWTRGALAGVYCDTVATAPVGSLATILSHGARADELVDLLCVGDIGLIHGELTASNIVVPIDPDRPVCVVDWELCGIGPRLLDLASLVVGWQEDTVGRFVDAYVDGAGRWDDQDLRRHLDAARLHLAMRWLAQEGRGWRPPIEHRTDWAAEARGAADRLGW